MVITWIRHCLNSYVNILINYYFHAYRGILTARDVNSTQTATSLNESCKTYDVLWLSVMIRSI